MYMITYKAVCENVMSSRLLTHFGTISSEWPLWLSDLFAIMNYTIVNAIILYKSHYELHILENLDYEKDTNKYNSILDCS